jgi:transposase-like protein
MPMLPLHNETAAGAATADSRGPTVVAAPAAVSPELSNRPRRHTFTVADKLRILAATDRALETGGVGAVLRREGDYSSTLCDWRRQREAGTLGALTPARRGPKALEANPLAAKLARLEKNNAHLTRSLARAEAIITVQKKLADLLGIPMTPDGGVP